ncbi:MAG: hypothetical protein WAP03_26875 [Methylorubrum rhodinum]|uniref:hypothetical protein n=1 Tax=Methylorubrum rhodinum TaxID=29428 RepID=UPI003BAE3828
MSDFSSKTMFSGIVIAFYFIASLAPAKSEPITLPLVLYSVLFGKALFNQNKPHLAPVSVERKQIHKLLYKNLSEERTIEELVSLSSAEDPCMEMDCMGISSNSVAKLVNFALVSKKERIDAIIRQQQAWASIGSLFIAILSLILSTIVFLRSNRTKQKLS